jgi:hypothetical protein
MKLRHIALAAASIAALAPAISNASPEKAALNACARAFASSLAAPGAAAPTFKVAYRDNRYVGSMLEFYTREYSFDLHANDVKTGLPIARASCSTNSHGTVVSLSSVPLDAEHPALASARM